MKWRLAAPLAAAFVLLVLCPADLLAWTPGTHIYLGESILANLGLLPAAVADLLRAFPFDFLYGNIAADSSIAKKYAPVGRHCHHWPVGQQILARARTDALRSFAHGYLCHLAADTVAHNFYVPRQLVITSSTTGFGHSYWESRLETHLGDRFAHTARDIIRLDHTPADTLLDGILAPTIFSVKTNRRLFRGMVYLTESQGWQRAFQVASEVSRWDLPADEVESYMTLTFDLIMEYLSEPDATVLGWDPSGEQPLRTAKGMRRQALVAGAWRESGRLREVAEVHFGLPDRTFRFLPPAELKRPWRVPPQIDHASA
ncbi:MAG: zinc dependent phospholipase C family protein [Gemmatimonadales bacterium]